MDIYNITADININNLLTNYEFLKKKSKCEVMPILKSNAYGLGMIELSKIFRKYGVKYIGVATIREALILRKNGDTGRILAWLYDVHSSQVKRAINKNIDIAIFSYNHIDIISKQIPKNKIVNIHLFVDTGINRNGVVYKKGVQAALKINTNPNMILVGLMSHLCCSDSKNNDTYKQLELFRNLRKRLVSCNIIPELVHIGNSTGIINYDMSEFNLVRSGGAIYGLINNKNILPVVSCWTKIIQLKYIDKGEGIGYNKTYITTKKKYVAILQTGYSDIFSNSTHNKIYIKVNGTRRLILGKISMDQIVIDARKTDLIADKVYFFGDKQKGVYDIFSFSKMLDTLTYAVISKMGPRIVRNYIF